MKRYQLSPSIESTDQLPKYIVLVHDAEGHPAQAGEFHEISSANQPIVYKAYSFRRIVQEFYHRDQAINYIMTAYRNKPSKAHRVQKEQIQMFQ